jgi:hypothetical protein
MKDNSYPPENGQFAPPAGRPPSKEPPPQYAPDDPVDGPTAAELTSAFANLKLSTTPTAFPAPDQTLAHLKLLNAFYSLKEDVGYTDGLFGIKDSLADTIDGKIEEALAKIREKRWALFVARAVERFEDWWLKFLCQNEAAARLKANDIRDTESSFTNFTENGHGQTWTTANLPPLGLLFPFSLSYVVLLLTVN